MASTNKSFLLALNDYFDFQPRIKLVATLMCDFVFFAQRVSRKLNFRNEVCI